MKRLKLLYVNLLSMVFIVSGCLTDVRNYSLSDHFDGTHFHNPERVKRDSPLRIGRHILFGRSGEWPDKQVENCTLFQNTHDRQKHDMSITMVGHATLLVQVRSLNILTDPTWSHRVGPHPWFGPPRAHQPGIDFDALPKIDLVLISHNHYDHLDMPTLKRLHARDNPLMLVPLGDKEWMEQDGLSSIVEMNWWQEHAFESLAITFTPAQHNSGRVRIGYNESLWGGFMVKHGKHSLFYAGDTAYHSHFIDIKEKLGTPHIALLPIGAYEPRDMMKKVHMNPAEAVLAFKDLEASYALGAHFGTYQISAEDHDQPTRDLTLALKDNDLPNNLFIAPCPGKTHHYNL